MWHWTFTFPVLSISACAAKGCQLRLRFITQQYIAGRPKDQVHTPTGTHEQTINTALGEVLQQFGRDWTLRSEHVGRIFEEGGRPDILVEKSDGWPITIEAEVGNHTQAEGDARARLGNRLISTGNPIHASVALVYPDALRRQHGAALRAALERV